MRDLDRRSVLGAMLGAIAAAGTTGVFLLAKPAQAATTPGVPPPTSGTGPVEKAQVVVVGPRRRRRRCWWSRGRRVCAGRW